MKKNNLLLGVLALALVFTIVGCDNGSTGNGEKGTAPTITTASLEGGTVGTAYSQPLTATGDTPITWTVETGALPNGLTLSTAGVISGTPTTAGTFDFTVKATNTTGNNTKQLSIVIATDVVVPPPVPPAITTASLPGGTVGTAYSQTTLTATGDTPITWSIESGGTLPAGLSINAGTGVISGTPTTEGTSTFTVKATNATGSDTKQLSIAVQEDPTVVKERTTTITLFEGKTATVKGNLTKAELDAAAEKIEDAIEATFNLLSQAPEDAQQIAKGKYRMCETIIVEKTSSYDNWKTIGDGKTIYINFNILNDTQLRIRIGNAIESMSAGGSNTVKAVDNSRGTLRMAQVPMLSPSA